MSGQKYLIDTNVFIGLEDNHEISPELSALTSLASKHGVGLFVHEAARDDIGRDKDKKRRAISLSKVDKFQLIGKFNDLSEDQLSKNFGPLPKSNDVVDATLLHSLEIGAADFLVTEDHRLHGRARLYSPDLSRRILYIADAVSLLRATYEPISVPVSFVEEVGAHQIQTDDDIFNSLRKGYPGFDSWWKHKCVASHRECWVVCDDGLAGLVVRKNETTGDTDAQTPAKNILKVCTFKVRPENRGMKLGELLLKQVLWFSQANHYDLVYLTTFSDQNVLIDLLEYYGFQETGKKNKEEFIYEKVISRDRLLPDPNRSDFENARLNYPRFYTGPSIPAYVIPIKEEYHDQLFPELKESVGGPKLPGNTIRKVYLCRAQAKITKAGALLFFYKGKSKNPPSQAITAVGVFEDMKLAGSTDELRKLAGKRSVYNDVQLGEWDADNRLVKVINYLLVGYIKPPVSLDKLKGDGILESPPRSITGLDEKEKKKMLEYVELGFDL